MEHAALIDKLRAHGISQSAGRGPIYLQLAEALRGLIDRRELLTGNALPAERELAEDLSVSRITVRNAYRELISTGELEVRRGSGTFVSRQQPHIEQSLWRLSSFSEEMTARGMKAESRVVSRVTSPPGPDEIFLFDVPSTEPMLRLDRLRIAEGLPVALERAVVPLALVADMPSNSGSLYEALTRSGHKPVRATQRLTATTFTPETAALLGVDPGAACLLIERVSRAADGHVVEYTRSRYRGDAYDFIAELSLES